ncbi:hypothetical protein GYA13_01230 [Candidatus Kuenenbacteria bacterium]|nr:hypothetical protein [Candidatus Kuenenbacteria bacterium]
MSKQDEVVRIGGFLSADFIGRMEQFVAFSSRGIVNWDNYYVSPKHNPMPIVVKVRKGEQVSPDTPYWIFIKYVEGEMNGEHKCLDRFIIYLHAPNADQSPEATLNFVEFAKEGEDVYFEGDKPKKIIRVNGKARKGLLYLAPLEGECRPIINQRESETLFAEACLVELPVDQQGEAGRNHKFTITENGEAVDVYDNRADKYQQFGMVRKLRKQAGHREFVIYEITDFDGDPADVQNSFSLDGFMSLSQTTEVM